MYLGCYILLLNICCRIRLNIYIVFGASCNLFSIPEGIGGEVPPSGGGILRINVDIKTVPSNNPVFLTFYFFYLTKWIIFITFRKKWIVKRGLVNSVMRDNMVGTLRKRSC